MRKFINPATVSEVIIESIRNDRKTMSLNELVFRHNLPYDFISKICKGISRETKQNTVAQTLASSHIRTILKKNKGTFEGVY